MSNHFKSEIARSPPFSHSLLKMFFSSFLYIFSLSAPFASAQKLCKQCSGPHQCSEKFAQQNASCTVTTIDSMTDFNASFTTGDAVKDYIIYPIWIGDWTEVIVSSQVDFDTGLPYSFTEYKRMNTISTFLKQVSSSSWWQKLYPTSSKGTVRVGQIGTTFLSNRIGEFQHKMAIQFISNLAALNPNAYGYNFYWLI